MATTTHGDLAAAATAHLRRSGYTIESGVGNSDEIGKQSACLLEWARSKKVILAESLTAGLQKYPGTSAEHEVFVRPSDNRAIKLTYPGTFGATPKADGLLQAATPLFYLARINLMNLMFDSDLKLEGITIGKSLIIGTKEEQIRMVISQPWIRGENPSQPNPSASEISQFMESLGFIPLKDSYYGWRHKGKKITILDAQIHNFIKSPAGVVPIDLVIGQIE
jgi:hypothetical protein